MIKSKQNGFTLIELVVVIVILGILAAFAVPRFMGLEGEARASAIKSMGGTLMAAASMARAKCQAVGCGAAGTVTIEGGQTVTMVNGYPNNATIRNALQTTEGYTLSQANRRFTKSGGGVNCYVQYNQPVNATAEPTLTYAPVVTNAGPVGTQAWNEALSNACR